MQNTRPLRIQATWLIAALVVQYALGMYTNLFVPFPDGTSGGAAWTFAWSQWPLAAHIALGLGLLLGGSVLAVRSFRRSSRSWRAASLVGLISLVLAVLSGVFFIPAQTDLYSYSMSLLFVIAVLAYAWGLMVDRSSAAV
jgi:hypothetical protein